MNESKWFTKNLADADAFEHPKIGISYLFGERYPRERFGDYGINVRVLKPGQPASLYHSEGAEESFLVLGGECRALVEGEWIALGQWDFLHCPPDTLHMIVGAGDGPSTVLMVGGRGSDERLHFPVNEEAATLGVGVERDTDDPRDAWAQVGLSLDDFTPARLPWPP